MVAVGPMLPKIPRRFIGRLLKNPLVMVSGVTLGVKIGRDAYQMKVGEIDVTEFQHRTGSHVGGVSGGVFGMAAGAAALSLVMPGVGQILGSFAGSIIGEHLGSKLGRRSAEYFTGTVSPAGAKASEAAQAEAAPPKKRTL